MRALKIVLGIFQPYKFAPATSNISGVPRQLAGATQRPENPCRLGRASESTNANSGRGSPALRDPVFGVRPGFSSIVEDAASGPAGTRGDKRNEITL
jgi:hypothetical protein